MRRLSLGPSILTVLAVATPAASQSGPANEANAGEGSKSAAPAAPAAGNVVIAPAPAGGVSYVPLGPSAADPNSDLPSGSRPIVGNTRDEFDLGKRGGSAVVFGGQGAPGVVAPPKVVQIPAIHLVKKGDTLWDLSGSYYQNPWGWPKVWSYNPQVKNPHWIYPGDQLRLRDVNDASGFAIVANQSPGGSSKRSGLRQGVAKSTIFLRDQGFLGDPERDVWGELVGSAEDQMLLADGNRVYVMVRPGVSLQAGQLLTIFTPVRKPDPVPGARTPPGEIVSVKGSIQVEQFDEKTRVARGEIVESLDVIERGWKVGPVGRSFDVVPPVKATVAVRAHVLTSIHPHVFIGQNQLAFLDRGSEDGVAIGNRLFVVRQGDVWRGSIKVAEGMLKDRVQLDSNSSSAVETTPTHGDDKKFPTEVVAELRILRTEKYSSIALVLESNQELSSGDVAVSWVGQ